ncbi:MAG: SAM-dependent methyltransferase [Clostridia bacterium]|nr:SAM-dependent methyltransferase [Clostridia bacterium]
MPIKLTPRLLTAVPYVRPGRLVADIGTDHAYLPIYLCEAGILTPVTAPNGEHLCAIAADINRGPVERADLHIASAGLTDRIRTVQTDGLCGLEVYDPADIIIFGMGGELIASILEASPWVSHRGKRLILQPMTHAEKLRAYLLSAGFSIIGETVSREGDRLYQTICAEPAGEGTALPTLTPAELAVGQASLHGVDREQKALYTALIDKTLRTETAARDARRRAGQMTPEADMLIAALTALRNDIS